MPPFLADIEPRLNLSEKDAVTLADVKQGQQIRVMMHYKVIEKTKSFTILRIDNIHLFPSKRTF